jgi:hypothetical protein
VVNVGRGSVVDEDAMAGALENGRVSGYAADVFGLEDWQWPDHPAATSTQAGTSRSCLGPVHFGVPALGIADLAPGRRRRLIAAVGRLDLGLQLGQAVA